MSKIFRLYKEGTTTYQGWNESPAFPYNSNARDTIEDPDGASAKNEITSIPSPFARIDLIKTAFKEVCRKAQNNIAELDGNTIFHKMVSDTLDVGEIFFNIDKFKGKIEIITWNPSTATASLMGDGNTGHYYVGDALQKYFESDAKTYNFGQLRNIYLLNYVNGPDEINIIGATSPATLFFSGANRLDYVNDVYFANNDKPFDVEYQPLYKRDFDYIKAWWVLRKTINGFSNLFPEIENYLNLTFRAISDPTIKNKLTSTTSASLNDFSPIDVHSYQQTNQVEVLGTALLKKKTGVQGDNQFTLRPERELEGTKPLVLPIESGNKYATLLYVNGVWGSENKAPYKDSNSNIPQRVLPYDGAIYPYLTISDFLEDTIVKVPHKLNKKYYFNNDITSANLSELKRVLSQTRLQNVICTMHVWDLMKSYFYTDKIRPNYSKINTFEEYVEFAKNNGWTFGKLEDFQLSGEYEDDPLDLTSGFLGFIRGCLNKKYFAIYSIFYCCLAIIILLLFKSLIL